MAHVDDFFDIITRHLTRQNGDQWNSMWQTGLPYTDSTGRGTVVVKAASVALDIRVPFPPDFFFLQQIGALATVAPPYSSISPSEGPIGIDTSSAGHWHQLTRPKLLAMFN